MWGILRAGGSRVEEMFDTAPVPCHEIDREGIIRRVNRAGCELLGYEREELIGRPVVDLLACEQQPVAQETIRRTFEGRAPLKPFIREYIRRDGERVSVCIHESAVWDRFSRIVALRSALVDVEEVLRLEKEARESEERHRRLLERAGVTEPAGEAEHQAEPVAAGLRMLDRKKAADPAPAEATPGRPVLPRQR